MRATLNPATGLADLQSAGAGVGVDWATARPNGRARGGFRVEVERGVEEHDRLSGVGVSTTSQPPRVKVCVREGSRLSV